MWPFVIGKYIVSFHTEFSGIGLFLLSFKTLIFILVILAWSSIFGIWQPLLGRTKASNCCKERDGILNGNNCNNLKMTMQLYAHNNNNNKNNNNKRHCLNQVKKANAVKTSDGI
jgi:hypothetical protein